MGKLNNESFNILLRQGTDANLKVASTFLQQGEPAYTTDSRKVYITDASNNHLAIPVNQALIDLTTRAAAISATTLYAVPAGGAGVYRVTFVAKVTQAATSSSTLGGTNGFQVTYTDADDSVTVTTGAISNHSGSTLSGNTTQIVYSGSMSVNAKASTNIQYAIDYTSSGVTVMQYSLHIKCEAL